MYLGIDCGTQGTKALLINEAGKVHGRGYAAHALTERPGGAREQDPAWWIAALIDATRQALAHAPGAGEQVAAIGVSGQQHGLVVLDEAMHVIRPAKLWNDTETAPQNAELIERFGGRAAWSERFGIVPLTGYTVSKLLWLKQHEPANFGRIRHILLPHEYLNWWLTGELCAEAGDASGTAFFDVRKRQWAGEILDSIDEGSGHLSRAVPRVIGPGELVGTLRREAAQALGLSPKCVVSAGGGDNMMGAIGTGNVREGVVTISLGTSSTVYSYANAPRLDPTGHVAAFCSSSGGWLPLVCTMNATNVVTQTVKLLGRTVEDIEAALGETPAGADGLIFLPFLNGERTPDLPQATGTLSGISAANLTASHLVRAAVEGVSFGILAGLDRILNGRPADLIQVIGGGARSRAWCQLLADATGARVVVPVEQESGCLGAAIQAHVAWSAGNGRKVSFEQAVEVMTTTEGATELAPDQGLRSQYDAARASYHEALRRIYPEAFEA